MPNNLADWLKFIDRQHTKAMDLGLTRVHAVALNLALLSPLHKTIVVAGTNGKGSVTAVAEQLLVTSKIKTGATFSPHLHHFNERIRIDGEPASDDLICAAFAEIESARGDVPITYFEFATLAALLIFRRQQVEVAILEIGLGGRLDAFNVVDGDVAVITSVGLDHQRILGDTIEQIGREKAGILRRQQAAVLGANMPASVEAEVAELELVPLQIHTGAADETSARTASAIDVAIGASNWQLTLPGGRRVESLPLGALLPENCAMAICAVLQLYEVADHQIRTALNSVFIAGRREWHQWRGRRLLLDIGHNPLAAQRLAEDFATGRLVPVSSGQSPRPITAVLGMLKDKDIGSVVAALDKTVVAQWILVPTSGFRGQSAQAQRDSLLKRSELPKAGLRCADSLWAGIELGCSLTAPDDVILVFGSFSVVEHTRERLVAN